MAYTCIVALSTPTYIVKFKLIILIIFNVYFIFSYALQINRWLHDLTRSVCLGYELCILNQGVIDVNTFKFIWQRLAFVCRLVFMAIVKSRTYDGCGEGGGVLILALYLTNI